MNAKVKRAAEAAFLAKLSALFRKVKTKQKTKWDFYFLLFGRCYFSCFHVMSSLSCMCIYLKLQSWWTAAFISVGNEFVVNQNWVHDDSLPSKPRLSPTPLLENMTAEE